jgi:G2/mitotic-specific cyclin 1/2
LVTTARHTAATQVIKEGRERDETEVEANRVFKKRRTSSEVPEDHKEDVKEQTEAGDQIHDIAERELQKHLQNIGREAEADPNGPDWEDLDAEDADDPMMVSEYVNEIFDYLKVIEVRLFAFSTMMVPIH